MVLTLKNINTGIIFSAVILCVFTLGLPSESFSQVAQTKRVEIELGEEYTGQKVYLFGEKGLILLSKTYEPAAGEIQLKFEHFNTNLEKTSDKIVAMEYFKGYNITYATDDRLWIFFHSPRKGNYTILEFDPVTGIIERHKGSLIAKYEVDFFRVLNGYCYFVGRFKRKPMMATLNLSSTVVDYPLAMDLSKKTVIRDLKVTDNQEQVHLLLRDCKRNRNCHYTFIPFDKNAVKQSISGIRIDDYGEILIGSCTTTGLKTGDYMAAGTYSDKNYETAQGVYISRFNESGRQFLQFYNFLDFENFLSYLSDRKQERIERKKLRKRARGKELKMNYRMIIHDLIERENEFILVGEVYYPTYRTETYTTVGAGGTPITRTRSVFDGYQYTHAAIASFDAQGNMNWSNTFEMYLTYKPFELKRFLTVNLDEKTNTLSMMFATGSKIKSVSYINGVESTSRDVEVVKTGNEDDRLRWTSDTDVKHWYGNAYLADGFQKIVNKEKKMGNRRRKVYFLNKVEF